MGTLPCAQIEEAFQVFHKFVIESIAKSKQKVAFYYICSFLLFSVKLAF